MLVLTTPLSLLYLLYANNCCIGVSSSTLSIGNTATFDIEPARKGLVGVIDKYSIVVR